ncbi:hypothetical protein [Treponema endosymbiont of Eucomonympha sp.]|uniref:hypothetical protein n=1 Tax=Treponema endosymbiont of Eucomonympha sp. TaxID=1580831 RepID=UPI000785E7F4|nr:hypothetical protein [Treponema endosymbiont of Eucomonympha sp.]
MQKYGTFNESNEKFLFALLISLLWGVWSCKNDTPEAPSKPASAPEVFKPVLLNDYLVASPDGLTTLRDKDYYRFSVSAEKDFNAPYRLFTETLVLANEQGEHD